MSLTINTNLEAMDAARNLNNTESMLSHAMQRLSSGLRINSAADDVAGYAISQSLQSQVNGLNQAAQNMPGRGRARADGSGRAERRQPDAPARSRAGRAVRQRHDLRRRPGSDRTPRSTQLVEEIEARR